MAPLFQDPGRERILRIWGWQLNALTQKGHISLARTSPKATLHQKEDRKKGEPEIFVEHQ